MHSVVGGVVRIPSELFVRRRVHSAVSGAVLPYEDDRKSGRKCRVVLTEPKGNATCLFART